MSWDALHSSLFPIVSAWAGSQVWLKFARVCHICHVCPFHKPHTERDMPKRISESPFSWVEFSEGPSREEFSYSFSNFFFFSSSFFSFLYAVSFLNYFFALTSHPLRLEMIPALTVSRLEREVEQHVSSPSHCLAGVSALPVPRVSDAEQAAPTLVGWLLCVAQLVSYRVGPGSGKNQRKKCLCARRQPQRAPVPVAFF